MSGHVSLLQEIERLKERLEDAWKSRDEVTDRLLVSSDKLKVAVETLNYMKTTLTGMIGDESEMMLKLNEAIEKIKGGEG